MPLMSCQKCRISFLIKTDKKKTLSEYVIVRKVPFVPTNQSDLVRLFLRFEYKTQILTSMVKPLSLTEFKTDAPISFNWNPIQI